jgi:lysophospholipase
MVLFHLSALALVGVAYALNGSIADYAPRINEPCLDTTTAPLLRSFAPNNQSLHPREEAYVDTRLSTVVAGEWKEWIGDIGYDLNAFNNSFPKVGLAISGGGYRAALYGAGVLSALDARNQLAKTAGTGGLLQVASYLAGLSGVCPARFPLSFSGL